MHGHVIPEGEEEVSFIVGGLERESGIGNLGLAFEVEHAVA